jgi:hypothetical protein
MGPDVVVDMTGTPSVGTDAEGNPTGFLANKLRNGHPDYPASHRQTCRAARAPPPPSGRRRLEATQQPTR